MKKITAHRFGEGKAAPIRAAQRERQWMEDIAHKYAYRCLPMVMANQFGWEILSTHHIRATWDGGAHLEALIIEDLKGEGPILWMSHFGAGILTFSVPHLFKTSPDWNLFVRGPTNRGKDGITALDGVVETDWPQSSFTMNWMFTRPCTVEFEIGEPACLFFPVPRRLFDDFETEMVDIEQDGELHRDYHEWLSSRNTFNADLKDRNSAAFARGWQKDYFQNARETKPRPKEFTPAPSRRPPS